VKLGQSAVRSDPGRKRRHNEDSYVCRPPLFAIADGMGGAQAGEVASELAAGALRESDVNGGGEPRVVELIQEANRRVHERASTDASTTGMGTTMTVALVESDGRVTIGHVGDSRAYRLRDDRLEQLTDDHSLVAELVRRGELSPQEAEVHPQRAVITRALGTDPDVDVDAFSVEAEPGDVYLICSDGLSDMVDAGSLEEIVRRYRGDLDQAARALVQAANKSGGEDNITAILFEVVADETPSNDGPDQPTQEAAVTLPTRDFEEEDTLHPEDHVQPPPSAPTAVDTMVVAPGDLDTGDTAVAPAVPAAEEARVSFWRRLLVLLVIAALVALIVVLVVWGLAR
jgi:serine/threonine protein phosphatase PrpC